MDNNDIKLTHPSVEAPILRGKAAVAAYLGGVSIKSIDSWVARRLLPFARLPGSRLMLFRKADVDAAIARFSTESVG